VITVNDLLRMRLNPEQFMAASIVIARQTAGTSSLRINDVAEVMGCSRSSAHRALKSLIELGLVKKVSNGVYIFHSVKMRPHRAEPEIPRAGKVFPIGGKNIPRVGKTGYVYQDDKTTSRQGSLEETNVSSNSGGAPLKGKRSSMNFDFDDGDDLTGFGLLEERPGKEVRRRQGREERRYDLKYHRTVPREEWDMGHVVKEFKHRMAMARSDILGGGTDHLALTKTLHLWSVDHDLTLMDIISAIDLFFADPVRVTALSERPMPYKVFLSFLQNHYRDSHTVSDNDDWLAGLENQMDRA